PAAGAPFASYAAACIRHAQQDARRAALRKKHAPLNFSVPLPDAENIPQPGPEQLASAGERWAATLGRMHPERSPPERRALDASLPGQPAARTAQQLGITPKGVANALARARRKLRG